MGRDLSGRFAIATMCARWKQIADEYGLPVELDHYCQAQNLDGERGDKVAAAIAKDLENYRALSLHGPFNELFPSAIDPEARAFAMKRFHQAADRAKEFGVKKMVVHSGWVPFIYFKEWHVPRSVEFWTEFMADQPDDFQLVIENVLDDEPYTLVRIAEEINDPRVGLCYDVGHANIVGECDQDEWLEVLAPHLKHLHIHNNDGKADLHKGFAEGTLDIERLLDKMLELCSPETTVTAEILGGAESIEWLIERGFLHHVN